MTAPLRALVVDDSRAMRMILGRILREVGAEVAEAADGLEALDLLEERPLPDVMLIDWNMPRMDGLALVGAVRSEPAFRDVTLMMVTSESESSQIVRALAAGAHEYLIKPFTPAAVTDKLSLLGLVPA